ncbi:MAG: hypothetical protein H6738_23750 [Alphaproteobacteria bacterium]|nr:hypothetical protein [Alphaproteobacteria bacterium]MCB9699822.1 hypothetical protein [Alphaproteobacteria bacterium]
MAHSPSRESIERFAKAAEAYREAFRDTQQALAEADVGTVPSWVFAVDRLHEDEVRALPEPVRRAELRRRQVRAALHALVELVALEDDGRHGPAGPPDGADQADLTKLDRFITVANFARHHGCAYVDGMFQPTERGSIPDPADTFDLPPARRAAPED